MPLLYSDVFDDIASRVRAQVNPYVAELINGVHSNSLPLLHGPQLKGVKGLWRKQFPGNTNPGDPLVIEIGCHLGNTLRDMALAHPEINFIGLDITFKRVVTSARRAAEGHLSNIQVALASAKQLHLLLEESEVDGVVLFFPDPWSKRKQQKNRLVNADFCLQLRTIIKPGGFFWFKTDDANYFEAGSAAIEAAGFLPATYPTGLPSERYESTFERKFKNEGVPSYEGVWTNGSLSSATPPVI